MNLTLPLAKAAVLMLLLMMPGFIFCKTGIADERFSYVLSQLLVYIVQPALMISSYLRRYDSDSMKGFIAVALITLLFIVTAYFFTKLIFSKKIPEEKRKVLRFGATFPNAGNIGIPLIIYTLGAGYAFYVQAALLVFNFTVFTLGRYLYSQDRKHLSLREAIINPGMLPSLIGFGLYITGLGGWIADAAMAPGVLGVVFGLVTDMLSGLVAMVAPVSMLIIGSRLADLKLKGLFSDGLMYLMLFLRLMAIPAFSALIALVLRRFGMITVEVYSLIIIISSTPCAALTTVMAELYDCDSVYASKLVAISTVLSVMTMPIMIAILG